eukprot:COSAG01_NODE_8386_length_2805_cov_5.632299_1_plen_210_part_00
MSPYGLFSATENAGGTYGPNVHIMDQLGYYQGYLQNENGAFLSPTNVSATYMSPGAAVSATAAHNLARLEEVVEPPGDAPAAAATPHVQDEAVDEAVVEAAVAFCDSWISALGDAANELLGEPTIHMIFANAERGIIAYPEDFDIIDPLGVPAIIDPPGAPAFIDPPGAPAFPNGTPPGYDFRRRYVRMRMEGQSATGPGGAMVLRPRA